MLCYESSCIVPRIQYFFIKATGLKATSPQMAIARQLSGLNTFSVSNNEN